jgi:chromosome segregation ATPase
MTAQLAPHEVLRQEVDALESQKMALTAQIKSLENTLQNVRGKAPLVDIECRQKIEAIQARHEVERTALVAELDPLKSQVDVLKNTLAAGRSKIEAVQRQMDGVIEERAKALAAVDARLRERNLTLAAVETSLASLKAKVSAI